MTELSLYQPAGMAHWAGSWTGGDETCGDCRFYSQKRCGKYRLMTGTKGATFPASTLACKHFERPVKHR